MKKYLSKLFAQPYCSFYLLIPASLITSFVVVFYTTQQSLIRSSFDIFHGIIFVFTGISSYGLYLILGHVSRGLDDRLSWNKHLFVRAIVQLLMGVFVLGLLVLILVNGVFQVIAGIDIRSTPYIERDFAIVMSCLTIMNVLHFGIYWYREARTIEWALSRSEQRVSSTEKANLELAASYRTLQDDHALVLEQSAHGLQLYSELRQQIKVLGQSEPICAMEVFAFHLQGEKSSRNIHIKTWSDRDLVVEDIESLQALEVLFPLLFVKLTREYLVNRYTIAKVSKEDAKHYRVSFVLDHFPEISITNETCKKIKDDLSDDPV